MATNIVDMNGWDTVAAISYQDVNDSIVRQGAAPQHFAQTAGDGSASATGDFGQWALTTGGAGADIMMSLPVTGGTVTIGEDSYPITPATARVLVRANFLPQPARPTLRRLQLQTKPTLTAGEEVASVEDMQPAQSTFLVNAALRQLLEDWLNANLQEFNHTFAVVDFDAQFALEGMTWLRPSHTGYAVAEPATSPTLANSVFAVMCLVDGKTDAQQAIFQVSPYAIPAGRKAGFVISAEKFLQHMMLDATPLMFQGIQGQPATDYFRIDNDGMRIINTKPLTLFDTKLDSGKTVTPTVGAERFHIEVQETELRIIVDAMQYRDKWLGDVGLDVTLSYNGASTLSLDQEKGIFDLTMKTQWGTGSVQASTALENIERILDWSTLVLLLVGGAGGITGKIIKGSVKSAEAVALDEVEVAGQDAIQAEEATVTACCGLVEGTAQRVEQIAARWFTVAEIAGGIGVVAGVGDVGLRLLKSYAEGDYKSLPKVTELTDGALGKAVMWPQGVPPYTLASAELNGALQLGFDYGV